MEDFNLAPDNKSMRELLKKFLMENFIFCAVIVYLPLT